MGALRLALTRAQVTRVIGSDDPDMLMMRFCRARKYDINAGVSMLASCIKWRIVRRWSGGSLTPAGERRGADRPEGRVGHARRRGLVRRALACHAYPRSLKQMEIGKTYTQGTDRQGRPVVYIHVAKHKLFDQSAKALEDFVLFQMESVRFLLADRADKVTMGASAQIGAR